MIKRQRADRAAGSERRQRAERLGRVAEQLCRLSLALRGYRVLARRYRTPVGEIDIVARRGDLLAVIEVKAREDMATAIAAVTPQQQQRLERAAAMFLARHPHLAALAVRFDVMVVAPWRWPHHFADAWRPA